MAEITSNLKLVIEDSYTSTAKANLRKLDTIGGLVSADADGDTALRSAADIDILPEDASVGGSGSGGDINLGSASQRLDAITVYGPLNLNDTATSYDLSIIYTSTTATADRTLTLDTNNTNIALTLEGDLSFLGSNSVALTSTAATALTLPTSGTVLSDSSTAIVTNKNIDSDNNTITNIVNADIKASAAIAYSKLSLTGSIINADINSSAAIAGTKISPNFGAQIVQTSESIQFNETYNTTVRAAQSGQGSDLTFTLPATDGVAGQVLKTDGSGTLDWTTTGTGTVTNVELTAPSEFVVTGSPITSSGTFALSWDNQTQNYVFAAPSGANGTPAFRLLVDGDLPATAVTAASYGSATVIPTFTVNANGRLTAAADVAIAIPSTQVTDFDEAAQDAIGTILTDTASIDFTYDDGTPTISAVVLPAGVDHDSLNNFVANEHVDHTSVTLTAGTGLSGGGDISANRTFNLADTAVTPASYGSSSQVASFTVDQQGRLTAAADVNIDHDALTNFVADEHVAHTGVSVVAGGDDGLTLTNNDLSANIGLSVDITGTTALGAEPASNDELLIYDVTGTALRKITVSQLVTHAGFAADWVTGDGTTKAVTHSLGSKDVIVQVYDKADDQTVVVDTVTRTDTNTVTLTSSSAPGASGWRVTVMRVN